MDVRKIIREVLGEEVIEETQTGQEDLEKFTTDILMKMADAIIADKKRLIFLEDPEDPEATIKSIPPTNTLFHKEEGYEEIGWFVNNTNIIIRPTVVSIRGKSSIKGELEYGRPNEYGEESYKIYMKHGQEILDKINEIFKEKGVDNVDRRDIYLKLYFEFFSTLLHELQHAYDAYRSKGKAFGGQQKKSYIDDEERAGQILGMRSGMEELSPEEIAAINKSRTNYLNLVHEINARFAQAMERVVLKGMDMDTWNDTQKPWKEVYGEFKVKFDGWRHLSDKMKKKLTRRLAKAYQEANDNLQTAKEKYGEDIMAESSIRKAVRDILTYSPKHT